MPLARSLRRRGVPRLTGTAPAAVVRSRGVDVALGELQCLRGELSAAARVGEGLFAVILADRGRGELGEVEAQALRLGEAGRASAPIQPR
jgi:hypothetical protein